MQRTFTAVVLAAQLAFAAAPLRAAAPAPGPADAPAWAQPFMEALHRDGEWNAVLNLNRLGLAAMERGAFALAAQAFDQAIVRVEAIYADDANAARARSAFNAEKVKDFKGEPYERAMMYFYRGLLYIQEGDYQNARAAFLAADRHDTLASAEDAVFAGDFGMMKYLASWASHCDGDAVRASQLAQEAQTADAQLRHLHAPQWRSMVLVDVGPAPVKWGDGQHQELLRFRPGAGEMPAPVLRRGDDAQIADFGVLGDIYFQASTRGGREVDAVLAGKAQFKDAAGAVGDTALATGSALLASAGMSGDRNAAGFGLAGMFLGLLSKGLEQAATPQADVRAWDSLPARVLLHGSTDRLEPAALRLAAPSGAALSMHAEHGACSFAWTRMGTVAPVFAAAAPDAERGREERNRRFRQMLNEELLPAR